MKTSPSFQLYPADFLAGTTFMSAEEVGGYIRLLCLQWMQGYIPDHVGKLSNMCGVPVRKMGNILGKFDKIADGKLANARMEQVRAELVAFRELGSRGGKKSASDRAGNSDWGKRMAAKRSASSSNEANNEAAHEANNEGTSEDPTKRSTNTQSHTHTQSQPQDRDIHAPAGRPSLEQAKAMALTVGVTELEAEAWWNAREASDWMKGTGGGGTTPVGQNWAADLKTFTNLARERRSRVAPGKAAATVAPAQESVWAMKQRLEAIVAELGKMETASLYDGWTDKTRARRQELREAKAEINRKLTATPTTP